MTYSSSSSSNIGCPVLRQGTSVITSTAAAAMFPNFYNHIKYIWPVNTYLMCDHNRQGKHYRALPASGTYKMF